METQNLFPTAVSIFDLNRNLTKNELKIINLNLEKMEKNTGNYISKNKYVLNNSGLKNLKKFFNESINNFLTTVFHEKTKLQITQSWLNKTTKNEFHHMHTHPNSYLSGVFYIKTKDDDKIIFHQNNIRSMYYKPIYENLNIYNSSNWWLPAKQNTLLLFLSDTWHSVAPVENEERISLSFNTFFSENFGSETESTLLDI